jgi:uncharacterized LabA/DUF88 family protein
MNNQAFIDGQNLTKGTLEARVPWKVDLKKFRTFLSEKYGVKQAFYFIGVYDPKYDNMYKFMEMSGYKVVFRDHSKSAVGKKKGNVDTDIVFSVMDAVYRRKINGKIVLVSGDGDYKKMVDRLVKDRKLRTIMFPNANRSSLYNKLDDKHKVRLYTAEVRKYLKLAQ